MAILEEIAAVLGVSVPVTRFLLCFVGSIPCSALARFVPAGRVRNLYAAATGIVLSYYSFGPEANLFFVLPIVVGYGSMVLARPHCGTITFLITFGFLLTWYAWSYLGFVFWVRSRLLKFFNVSVGITFLRGLFFWSSSVKLNGQGSCYLDFELFELPSY